jgi:electron transport complex protein RnfG
MKKQSSIFPILFLTLIACVSIITLALTDDATRDIIRENKLKEIREMLGEQFPEMTSYEYDGDVYTVNKIISIDNDTLNETIGYAFEAKGAGYGGTIEILVTLFSDLETLNGISIINHMETPGLGALIEDEEFIEQFTGIAIEDLELRKKGGGIDAITGATISSTAVVKAIRETTIEKINTLKMENEIE